MKKIDDSGIFCVKSNDGKKQNILIEHNNVLYKIEILSESYESQSYGRLLVLTDKNEFNCLKAINPERDYGISLAYRDNYSSNAFERIIKDFESLIKKFKDVKSLNKKVETE